jgi:hypothetical protein
MAEKNPLPQFGRNGPGREVSSGAADGTRSAGRDEVAPPPSAASASAANAAKVQMNNPETTPAPAAFAVTGNEPQHAYPLGRWTGFKNPFGRKTAPSREPAPVQGELSLDTLKVVRNDLSDADLEIVRAPEPVPPPPPRASPPAETLPAGLLISRITARIFGRT